MRRLVALCALTLFGVGSLLTMGGCASQQKLRFQSLNKRDQLRFAACRHKVSRNICPDDPDCAIKAGELYAKEPPNARLQFLIDYGCTKEILIHVDEAVRKKERESIGMDGK